MGLIITELKARKPELPYFDESFTGEYPQEAPFTVSELEEIYPTASGKSKEDPAYKEAALEATLRLQSGDRGYRALWKHIIAVSVADLKKNYSNLDVEFDLWKGESDADPLIPGLVNRLKESGLAYESQGALVVDVKEDTDTKEMPPWHHLKIRWRGAVCNDRPCNNRGPYGESACGFPDLSCGQASGDALCTGVPCSEKGGAGNT